MRKSIFTFCLLVALGCSDGKNDTGNKPNQDVENYSNENITPQVDYDRTDKTVIDTISSSKSADKQVEY